MKKPRTKAEKERHLREKAASFIQAIAVSPCGHPIRQAECIGTLDAQNLWRCKECGKEFLR